MKNILKDKIFIGMLWLINDCSVFKAENEKVPTLITYLGSYINGKFYGSNVCKYFILADKNIVLAKEHVFQNKDNETETIYTPEEKEVIYKADVNIKPFFQPKMGDVYTYKEYKIIIGKLFKDVVEILLFKNDIFEEFNTMNIATGYIDTKHTFDLLYFVKINEQEKYVYCSKNNFVSIKQGQTYYITDKKLEFQVVRCDQWPVEILINKQIRWLTPSGFIFQDETCQSNYFFTNSILPVTEKTPHFDFKNIRNKYYNFTFSNGEVKCCYTYYQGETKDFEILGLTHDKKLFGYLANNGSLYHDCSLVHKMNITVVDLTFSHIEMILPGNILLVPKVGEIWQETFAGNIFEFEILTDSDFPIKIRYLDSGKEFMVSGSGAFVNIENNNSNYYLQNVKNKVVEKKNEVVEKKEALQCWYMTLKDEKQHYYLYVVADKKPETITDVLAAIPKFACKWYNYLKGIEKELLIVYCELGENSKYVAYYENGDFVEFESPYKVSCMFKDEFEPTNLKDVDEITRDLKPGFEIVEHRHWTGPWNNQEFQKLLHEQNTTDADIAILNNQIKDLQKEIAIKNKKMTNNWNNHVYYGLFKTICTESNVDNIPIPDIVKKHLITHFEKKLDNSLFSEHQRISDILYKLKK